MVVAPVQLGKCVELWTLALSWMDPALNHAPSPSCQWRALTRTGFATDSPQQPRARLLPPCAARPLCSYDFMIDDQLRVWLLEVNASPTMEASTPITAQLCAEVQEDVLRLVVDRPAAGKAAHAVDIGRWQCIVDAGGEMKQPTYTGACLCLHGRMAAGVHEMDCIASTYLHSSIGPV